MNETINETKIMKEYPVLAIASMLYAVFYTACLYQNHSGITFPIFTAGTVYYFYFCFKHLNVKMKRDSVLYLVSIELLGISTCLTGDYRIIAMNKIAIFLLVISFLLHSCCEDGKWGFSKYVGAVITTVIMAFGCIGRPVTDMLIYWKNQEKKKADSKKSSVKYIVLGILISIPLVIVIMLLLVNADAIFANCIKTVFGSVTVGETFFHMIKIIVLTVVVFFCSYMLVSYLNQRTIAEEVKDKATGEPVIAITISAVLSAIYVIFSGIQIVYLFIGGATGVLSLPKGITYSMYARTGFFQLLFVCMLNLAIVLIGIYRFQESRLLKIFLCILTACTYVMIASSALRMVLYIQYQYLTFLRIFVLWTLFVITMLMTGVVISIVKKDFPLFRYSMIVMTVCYLMLSFSRPDYLIAKVNTDNMKKETQYEFFSKTLIYKDTGYLAYYLGSDAAPVLITDAALDEYVDYNNSSYDCNSFDYSSSPAKWRCIYISRIDEKVSDTGWRNWNLSRYIAKNEIGDFSKNIDK